jgi:hypothetical protein
MLAPSVDIPLQSQRLLTELESSHTRLHVTPEDNPAMAYELSVPRGWTYSREFGPVVHGLFETRALGFVVSNPAPGAPLIAITVTQVPFEIPIDTWARLTLAAEGFQILAADWRPGPRGLFFDVTAWRERGASVELRRTTVRVDGSRVLSVNCVCAREHWDAAKETFWLAHLTFKLVSRSGQTRMEPWSKAVSRGLVFVFAYPRSWSAEPLPVVSEHVSGVDVRLTDAEQNKLLAYLQIRAARSPARLPSLPELEAQAAARLQRSGVTELGPREPINVTDDPRAAAVDGWLGGSVGSGELSGAETTVRLGWVDHAGRLLSFVALSPPLARAPLTALRAQRAFEIARASLQLGS